MGGQSGQGMSLGTASQARRLLVTKERCSEMERFAARSSEWPLAVRRMRFHAVRLVRHGGER